MPTSRVDELEALTELRLNSGAGPTITAGAGDPNGAITAPIGSVRLQTDTNAVWQNTDGTTAWSALGAGSGGIPAYDAGEAYATGDIVQQGGYVWRASTAIPAGTAPLIDLGNVGDSGAWTLAASGGAGASQTPNNVTLINNVAGQSAAIYSAVRSDAIIGKMIILDASLQGAADWMVVGFWDGANVITSSNPVQAVGFFGVAYNLFNQRFDWWADNVQTAGSSYANAMFVNGGAFFTRWYNFFTANPITPTNWDIGVWRDADSARFPAASATVVTAYSSLAQNKTILMAGFGENLADPGYATYRVVINARTGGSAGIFRVQGNVYLREPLTNPWTLVTRLGSGLSGTNRELSL